jgi:hypothetical protein
MEWRIPTSPIAILAQDHAGEEEKYTLVLANPPFELGMLWLSTLRGLFRFACLPQF